MKLICYLSNGYPTIESSVEMAGIYSEAGCDVIEIDFPSRNPYLESELISGRMAKALENCSDFQSYMEGVQEAKKKNPNTSFILLSYENTIKEMGYGAFEKFCLEQGFLDLILVGLEDDTIKNKLIEAGIRVSCYVQYHLDEAEVESAIHSNGFVYLQAKPTTGNVNPDYPELKDCIQYLRSRGITRPIYCGVGIYQPEDVRMAKEAGADGVFVGSTILKLHDDVPALKEKIKELKAQC